MEDGGPLAQRRVSSLGTLWGTSAGASLLYVKISVRSLSSSKFSPPPVTSAECSQRDPAPVFVGHVVWYMCGRFKDDRCTAVRGGETWEGWGDGGTVADDNVFRVRWGDTHGKGVQSTTIGVAH